MPKMQENKRYAIPNVKGKQKAIRIKKAQVNKDNLYSLFRLDAIKFAIYLLSPSAFKIWTWFNMNIDNYQFALSGKEVQKACHISKATYDKGIKELIENGFLRPAELFPNFMGYIFVEFGDNDGPYREEYFEGSSLKQEID